MDAFAPQGRQRTPTAPSAAPAGLACSLARGDPGTYVPGYMPAPLRGEEMPGPIFRTGLGKPARALGGSVVASKKGTERGN